MTCDCTQSGNPKGRNIKPFSILPFLLKRKTSNKIDLPDAVVNLPDGVPVTAERRKQSAGASGLRDQRAAEAEPQGGTRRGRSSQVSDGIGAEPTPPFTTAEAQMLHSVHS